jgi:hypothetical protein
LDSEIKGLRGNNRKCKEVSDGEIPKSFPFRLKNKEIKQSNNNNNNNRNNYGCTKVLLVRGRCP